MPPRLMQARLNKYINEVRLLEIREIERMPFRDIETSRQTAGMKGKGRGRRQPTARRPHYTRTCTSIVGSVFPVNRADKKQAELLFSARLKEKRQRRKTSLRSRRFYRFTIRTRVSREATRFVYIFIRADFLTAI